MNIQTIETCQELETANSHTDVNHSWQGVRVKDQLPKLCMSFNISDSWCDALRPRLFIPMRSETLAGSKTTNANVVRKLLNYGISRFSSFSSALTTVLPESVAIGFVMGLLWSTWRFSNARLYTWDRALQAYSYLDLYSHRPNGRHAHVEGQIRRATRPSNDILPSALYAHLPRSFLLGPHQR